MTQSTKYEHYLDEGKNTVVFRIKGIFNCEEGVEAFKLVENFTKRKRNISTLIDARDLSRKFKKDVRQLMKDVPNRFKL